MFGNTNEIDALKERIRTLELYDRIQAKNCPNCGHLTPMNPKYPPPQSILICPSTHDDYTCLVCGKTIRFSCEERSEVVEG